METGVYLLPVYWSDVFFRISSSDDSLHSDPAECHILHHWSPASVFRHENHKSPAAAVTQTSLPRMRSIPSANWLRHIRVSTAATIRELRISNSKVNHPLQPGGPPGGNPSDHDH